MMPLTPLLVNRSERWGFEKVCEPRSAAGRESGEKQKFVEMAKRILYTGCRSRQINTFVPGTCVLLLGASIEVTKAVYDVRGGK
jgi:hypothetical protein